MTAASGDGGLRGRAEALLARHVPGRPLVLPNAWDSASARDVVGAAGALALGAGRAGEPAPLIRRRAVDHVLAPWSDPAGPCSWGAPKRWKAAWWARSSASQSSSSNAYIAAGKSSYSSSSMWAASV